MSTAGHRTLAQVINDHVVRQVRRRTASQRAEIGRVTQIDPSIKIFFQQANYDLPAAALFFADSCPQSKLRVGDIVGCSTVGGRHIVHDVIRLAHATKDGSLSGSTALLQADTSGLSSAQIDGLFIVRPPNGTTISDPGNHLLMVRQGGKWCKTTLSVIT